MKTSIASSDPSLLDFQEQINSQTGHHGVGPTRRLPTGATPFSLITHETPTHVHIRHVDSRGKPGRAVQIPKSIQYFTGLTSSGGPPTTNDIQNPGGFGFHFNSDSSDYYFAYNNNGVIIFPGTTIYDDSATVRRSSGAINAASYNVNGTQVVGAQGATVAAPTGGTTTDTQARASINAIISRLQAHGLIA